MLINLSNHPSSNWPDKQLESAFREFGNMVEDIPFPAVDPFASEGDIQKLAEEYADKCMDILSDFEGDSNAVHIIGEFNFCFAVISQLLKKKIKCVASTSDRISFEDEPGEKTSKFNFVKFREYHI